MLLTALRNTGHFSVPAAQRDAAGSFSSLIAEGIAAASGNKVDVLIAVCIVNQRAQTMRHTQLGLIAVRILS